MFCPACGAAIQGTARFCPSCGSPASPGAAPAVSEQATHRDVTAASQVATRPAPSSAVRTPSSSSGWLSSSDSIDHGRFAPGTILDTRYRIIGLIGRGGMGEVYRADDLRLGQPVALKFLPENLRSDSVRLAQFHNEVRTARQVSHPNICRVYDIGEFEGHLYLSMEYVDGEDLASSLRRIGRFPEDKAVELARQLCSGLAAAHERGVLHRDLKPANVMLDGTGKVRVMDFGLAAVGPVADVRAGTPAYMAPEQLQGREVTARSDIFALGLVLYELFTGRRAFTAGTIGELVAQHEGRSTTPPTQHVSGLDPAIERAIQRCLEPDPNRRPSSALAVAAALPGGDPLAAALAAGETPSPEMVAAAGEGTALSWRIAVATFLGIVAGCVVAYGLGVRTNPLEHVRPEYSSEVLAQKARDLIRQIGYTDSFRDDAYGFGWDEEQIDHIRTNDVPEPRWDMVLAQSPAPLIFWYRRSPFALTALQFHQDLLTPGIVDPEDPPPILSGMAQAIMDHDGRLRFFEAIPPQRQDPAVPTSVLDWAPLLSAAGLDATKLQPAEPEWNWLSGPDVRMAWTGSWPESGRPLRVEAAAYRGRPVGFLLIAPWTTPRRAPAATPGRETVFVVVLFVLTVLMLAGAGVLARKNLREGRGDRRGAFRLACWMTLLLMALWVCQVHLVASVGLFAMFLVAIVTSVFYGVFAWTMYLALEPFVRRLWPQTLVSWTTLLNNGARDPVVGRDVLFGAAIGLVLAIFIRGMALWTGTDAMAYPGSTDVLLGIRGTLATVLMRLAYAIRSALFFFFLLFLFRALLRNRWAAAFAFAVLFAALNALSSTNPLTDSTTTLVYFGLVGFAVLRWGLLSLTVSVFVGDLFLNMPTTRDFSAWYSGNMLLLVGLVIVLAGWAFYTSVGRQLFRKDLFA